jgi:hypothetical protein
MFWKKRKWHRTLGAETMRNIGIIVVFVIGLVAPALAQRAEIEAVNAKWTEFFNKGDFAGGGFTLNGGRDRVPTWFSDSEG